MITDFVNIGLGFFEGLGLIVSPCILPILPIILAGSLSGSKKHPIGVIIGFIVIFSLFLFFSRTLVRYLGIDLNLIRHISYGILLLLGIIMLSNYLTEKFTQITQGLANIGSRATAFGNSQSGFFSGFLFGGLAGIVWTPCAGPILAAVIVQTVMQKTTFMGFLTVLAFGIGAGIPMLAIALFGREVMANFNFLKAHLTLLRKLLGILIIIGVGYMIYFEHGIPISVATETSSKTVTNLENALPVPYPAPQIEGITAWINSKPLQLSNLKGKVVLVDFWTYSCINCIRTLPYLKSWYKKYREQGFVIIGVHSPEFDFEKDFNNVKNAVQSEGIEYPVALDNQFVTWQNFANNYWPAHYLIDKNGYVVYQHFGEGEYDITENNIRFLLGMKNLAKFQAAPEEQNISLSETPETYLGFARADLFASPEVMTPNMPAQYTFPQELPENAWALQGMWLITADKITSSQANAMLKINFNARKVFMVMGSSTSQAIKVKILLNGKPVIAERGKDVIDSTITVKEDRLYEVIVLNHFGSGVLQVIPSAPGLEIYTFTFGRDSG